MRFKKDPESGDPSNINQYFEEIDLNVHCCRYWWLKQWHHMRLSYPYWELYWNKVPGAYVFFKDKVMLDPGNIILISPHTSFATAIVKNNFSDQEEYCMEGGEIMDPEKEMEAIGKGHIIHLFLHFNLGYLFDNTEPGIYHFQASPDMLESIERITGFLKQGEKNFKFKESLEIYKLIISVIRLLPANTWGRTKVGSEILDIINFIQRHLNEHISVEELARHINMTSTSFKRVFKQQTGYTIQSYIRKMRIENASRILHHSEIPISKVAEECGFSDRYYFTKMFTRATKIPPALYRKRLRQTS